MSNNLHWCSTPCSIFTLFQRCNSPIKRKFEIIIYSQLQLNTSCSFSSITLLDNSLENKRYSQKFNGKWKNLFPGLLKKIIRSGEIKESVYLLVEMISTNTPRVGQYIWSFFVEKQKTLSKRGCYSLAKKNTQRGFCFAYDTISAFIYLWNYKN